MIILPFISLYILYVVYKQKNKGFNVVHLLFITYLISIGIGVVANILEIHSAVLDVSFVSMSYLSIVLLITMSGFTKFNYNKLKFFKIDNILVYKILEKFIILSGILSLLFYAPFAAIALAGDIGENRMFNAVLQEAFGSFGLINSFAALFANTFVLAQTFFFIRLASSDFGQSRMVSFLLLVSSLSYIIYTLAFVGRDGVILWSMTFVFQYLFFEKFMTKVKRKKIKRLGFLLITLAAVPFMVISVSRFGSTDKGTMWYLLNYFYQQTVNFNDQFHPCL